MSTSDPTVEVALPRAEPESGGRVSQGLEEIRTLLQRQQRDSRASFFARIDRILAIAGAVVLPLGIAAIFLGWYGAARTPLLFEQIPYLISGGLLGVGLMLGGGMLFFGSWLARLAEQDRRGSQDLVDALEDLRASVTSAADSLTAATAVGSASGAAAAVAATGGLVATPTGSMAHRPECSVVADRAEVVQVPPTGEGYRACKLCDPELTRG